MSILAILFYASLFIAAKGTEQPTEFRALFSAYKIPDDVASPHDNARLKVLYPRKIENENENCSLPVVIFLHGTGAEENRYQWLAERLLRDITDVIIVLPGVFVSFPGFQVIFPGTGGSLTEPEPVLVGLFSELERMNSDGVLAGKMDLNKVILGGHSAGGIIALINANTDFFPGIVATFSYGANFVIETDGGYPPAAVLNIGLPVPALHLGGDIDLLVRDGELFPPYYGPVLDFIAPLFPAALDQNYGPRMPACFIEFVGFNHFAILHPLDRSSEILELDNPSTVDGETMRDQLGLYISLFVKEHGHDDVVAGATLKNAIDTGNPYIGYAECTHY